MKFGEIDLTSSDPGQIIYTSATDAIVGNNNLYWNSTDNSLLIGNNTATPEAILNLTSTTQGVYVPKMDTTQRDAISSPQSGLMIFNTDTNQFNFYDGSNWQFLFVGYPSCIQDNDNDTSICVSNFNDITVSLGAQGGYAANASMWYFNHSGSSFTGTDGYNGTNPGTALNFAGGNGGVGAGPGSGGGFSFGAGDSGDTFSNGSGLVIQPAQNTSGGSIALVSGSTTGTGATGGTVTIQSGDASDGAPGTIEISSGNSTSTVDDAANINIFAGVATGGTLTNGGDINLTSGSVTGGSGGNGGDINIFGGSTDSSGQLGGDVILRPGDNITDSPTGVGGIYIGVVNGTSIPADLRFIEGSGSNYVGFKAPTSISTNSIWTLPTSDGSNRQHLTTNGSGVLSWSNNRFTSTFTTAGGTGVVYSAGVLTITHNLEQYLSSVVIINNTDTHITPSSIVYTSATVVTVNISAFDPIPGTWRVVIKV